MSIATTQASRTKIWSLCTCTVQKMTTITKVPSLCLSGKSPKATQALVLCLVMILKVFSWSKVKVCSQPRLRTTSLARWVPSMWTLRAKEEYITINSTLPLTMCCRSRITITEWSQITHQTQTTLTSTMLWAKTTILSKRHLGATRSLTRQMTQC